MPDHVVAYSEKLLKTIATRRAIFSLKFTKNRLAARPRPDPGPAATWGLFLREGRGKGGKRKGKERMGG